MKISNSQRYPWNLCFKLSRNYGFFCSKTYWNLEKRQYLSHCRSDKGFHGVPLSLHMLDFSSNKNIYCLISMASKSPSLPYSHGAQSPGSYTSQESSQLPHEESFNRLGVLFSWHISTFLSVGFYQVSIFFLQLLYNELTLPGDSKFLKAAREKRSFLGHKTETSPRTLI